MRPLYRPTAQLKIAITGRCTNDCPICFNDTRRRDNAGRADLDPELLGRLIDEAARLGFAGVYWTGGEPLLRYRDVVELTRRASKQGLAASVVTNAAPLAAVGAYRDKNRALLEEAGTWGLEPAAAVAGLLDAGLDRVFISIDNSHTTSQGVDEAPATRVPTAVVTAAVDALLDAGFGQRHAVEAIGHRLRIAVTGNGAWSEPSRLLLDEVVRGAGLTAAAGDAPSSPSCPALYEGPRGVVAVRFLETAKVGAALVLPDRLLERRQGEALFSIRCGNMKRREDAYDGGAHHQDISVNHDGEVALCGNFMYPVGHVAEDRLEDIIGRVNAGDDRGPYGGTSAVLHRLFTLAEGHGYGATAIGEAFRILSDEDPALLDGIRSEGGACHALGRDRRLQERFVAAFDRRFS